MSNLIIKKHCDGEWLVTTEKSKNLYDINVTHKVSDGRQTVKVFCSTLNANWELTHKCGHDHVRVKEEDGSFGSNSQSIDLGIHTHINHYIFKTVIEVFKGLAYKLDAIVDYDARAKIDFKRCFDSLADLHD